MRSRKSCGERHFRSIEWKGLDKPTNQPERRVLLASLKRFEDKKQLLSSEKLGWIHQQRGHRIFPSLIDCIKMESENGVNEKENKTKEVTSIGWYLWINRIVWVQTGTKSTKSPLNVQNNRLWSRDCKTFASFEECRKPWNCIKMWTWAVLSKSLSTGKNACLK